MTFLPLLPVLCPSYPTPPLLFRPQTKVRPTYVLRTPRRLPLRRPTRPRVRSRVLLRSHTLHSPYAPTLGTRTAPVKPCSYLFLLLQSRLEAPTAPNVRPFTSLVLSSASSSTFPPPLVRPTRRTSSTHPRELRTSGAVPPDSRLAPGPPHVQPSLELVSVRPLRQNEGV